MTGADNQTLAYWLATLAPETPWQECYPVVGETTRVWLEAEMISPDYCTMTCLAKGAFPALFAKPLPITINANVVQRARQRLFQALRANAQHDLAQYAVRGTKPVKGFNGKMGLPWYWSAPNLVEDL